MRALALLLCLLSTQAWGAADTYVRAPWRAVTWIHAPDLMWVVAAAVALIAVWIVFLLRGDRQERRLGSLLAVLLLVGVSFNAKLAGTTFYVRVGCANNGNGATSDCAASGGAAGAYNVMSSITSSADGQVELAVGNTVYLIGQSTVAWNPGGITATFNGSYFTLRCDHSAGSGGFSVSSGAAITFGGGSRTSFDVGQGCTFNGGGTTGLLINNGSYVRFHGATCTNLTSACAAIEPTQDGVASYIDIYDNTASNIGADYGEFSSDPGAWAANTAYGLGAYRRPTTANGYAYEVTTAGTSGGSAPTWSTTVGGTTADGTVVWTTRTPTGEAFRIAPARNASGTAPGLANYIRIFNNDVTATTGGGRYGVSAYPCSACSLAERLTSGQVRFLSVFGNTFRGDYLYHAINFTNDVDDSGMWDNTLDGTFGASALHVGGQGTYGTCNASTDRILIADHVVSGGVVNAFNPSDGAGIYADECATYVRILRNAIHDNAVAGIYLNDADNVTATGNVMWNNGDNAVHIHGAGINFVAQHNSSYHTASSPSGVAEQGTDGWQIDGSVGAGTTLTDNAIKCASTVRKCVDADVAITETYNSIYHPTSGDRAEGFTPDATDLSADPQFSDAAPTSADGFCLKPTSPLLAAGTYIGAWATGYGGQDLGKPPAIGARGLCLGRAPADTRVLATGRAQ